MNIIDKLKSAIQTKSMVKGSYSLGSVGILGAILLVICLVVSELPSKYTKIDLSSEKFYTLGDQTEALVGALDTDVTLYFVAGTSSDDTMITQLLERYEDLSDHITVERRDMVTNPTFVSQYTSETLSSSSVIVVSNERYKVVNNSDMYETEMNYQTYASDVTGFDGEGQITSAIDYVTSEELPKVYLLEGHGETTALSPALQKAIEKENLETETLSLLTEESVPEDADCLMILGPATDFSDDETAKILAYLEAGNTAFIASGVSGGYTNSDLPNFNSILENYGVEKVDGVVFEGNSNNYYPDYPYYLIPTLQSHAITSNVINSFLLLPNSQGLVTQDSYRSTLTIESLLSTSSSAYAKTDVDNITTMEKEASDIKGAFDLAVAITETYDNTETKLVVVSSDSIYDADADSAVSGGNTEFIVGALSWMVTHETTVSIAAKSLATTSLTLTAGSVYLWTVFCTVVLPLGFIIVGAVIWFRRRRA